MENPLKKIMRRPPYVFDYDTKNLSFVETAVQLKKLGIKNYKFFLKLYDTGLKGVDPFSPYLTEELIVRIINECIVNPWYFLRECVRIPEQGGGGMPYQLHRANLAQTFCFLLGIDHYVVIPRQKGKTQSAIAILDWAFLFGTTNSEFAMINKRGEDANANLDRLKKQRDELPSYMQMKISYDEDGKEVKERNNVRSLSNPANGNRIVTKPSATSKEAADGIGRGSTQPVQYYDEVEFTPYIKTIIEAAGPAFATASNNAKRNKAAYCRIFTSTPGDLDSQPGKDAAAIIKLTCKWSEQLYDWAKEDIEEYVAKNSENNIMYIEYDYTQLGEDRVWFDKQCRLLNNEPLKIKRELLLKRLHGSSESPFDAEDIDQLQEMKGKIQEEIFINKLFPITLYAELQRKRLYFVGVDIAHGFGPKADSSAVVIVDPYDLKVVGEFKSPNIGEVQLAQFVTTLVRRYIPKSIVVVEQNKGTAVIELLRQTDIGHTVYFENSRDPQMEDVVDRLDGKGFLEREAERRRLFGVWTSTKSRERMYNLLKAHVRDRKDGFVGHMLISEIAGLVVKSSGKIEAGPGSHDDVVMAYLMVLYVYYHGRNLARFGFLKGEIPDEKDQNKGLDQQEIYELMPTEMKEFFGDQMKSRTIYDQQRDFAAEIVEARRLADAHDSMYQPRSYAENLDRMDDDGDSDLSFFNDLNDF